MPVWSAENIPVPDDAVMVRDNASRADQAIPFSMRLYRTAMPVAKLSAFFLKEMMDAGWQGEKKQDGVFMFKKGQETVFIVIVPPRRKGSLTQFTITTGTVPSEDKILATRKDKPDKLSFMPLYPNSKQILLMDLPSGAVTASYTTNDSIKEVIFFYKAQMLNSNWVLVNESPIEDISTDCPSCKKNMESLKGSNYGNLDLSKIEVKTNTKKSSLLFQRGNGESCVINVLTQKWENPPAEFMISGQGNTTIGVVYSEAKLKQ
jgi:hypothetical protein